MSLPNLYDHQVKVVDDTRAALARHRRVILCGRTGFGKSVCAKWIAGKVAENDKKVVLAVHRRGLVDNLSQAFTESPELRHGVIMSQEETRSTLPIQIASIDTLLSWYCEGEYDGPEFDLIVFDEAHAHHSKLVKFVRAHGGDPFVIGLTATPEADGLPEFYNKIVKGPSAEWLEQHNYAASFSYLCGRKGRLDQLVKQGERFTDASQDTAMKGLQGEFVRDWLKHAETRPTVGFFPRLSHAQEASVALEEAGVDAGYVDGQTPDDVRRDMFRRLGCGQLQYICNVGVIERGTNIPQIACIQLCLAIGSKKRYLQMLGRGSRTCEGKADTLVLDHGGNVHRHGLYTDEVNWSLDQSTKKIKDQAVRSTIECPQCQAIYRGGRCRQCGYEPSVKERKSQGLEFDGSELVPYKPRRRKRVQDPEKLLISCLYRAARSGRTYSQACGMASGIAKRDGFKMKWPKQLFIGNQKLELPRWGSPDQTRRVVDLYPWMAR